METLVQIVCYNSDTIEISVSCVFVSYESKTRTRSNGLKWKWNWRQRTPSFDRLEDSGVTLRQTRGNFTLDLMVTISKVVSFQVSATRP
jgi:hypothetical protein